MEQKDEVTDKMEKLNVEEEKKKESPVEEEKKEMPVVEGGEEEVEVGEGVQEFSRNQESCFLSSSTSWDDEKLGITEKLKQALRDADVLRPSKIQAYAIPIINEKPWKSVVAQSQNGSGKTFTFALCSLLRIDPTISSLQVLILAHTRELVNQIYDQILILNKYTAHTVSQIKKEDKSPKISQITLMTAGKCATLSKFGKLKFDSLKMVVIDEADHFFGSDNDKVVTSNLIKKIDGINPDVQKLFFSATYEEHVREAIK